MLQKLRRKITGTEFEERIAPHRCEINRIGISGPVDFVLMFFMVHEVPNKVEFFNETAQLLKPGGYVLIVEPPFHVSSSGFDRTYFCPKAAGLAAFIGRKMFLSKTSLLQKGQQEAASDAGEPRR